MLEVLTRRYYGNKGLTGVGTREVAGCTFVIAERADSRVLSSAVRFDGLRPHACAVSRSWPGDRTAVDADIYLAWESQPADADAMAARATSRSSARTRCRTEVRRLTATVAGRGGAVMHHHFTFRASAAGMTEERLIRGLHPFVAQRMQLERLQQVRPDPAAVVGRGGLPLPVRGAG